MATRPALALTASAPVEAVAALALAAGTDYTVEALDGPVLLVESTSAEAPAPGTRGHLLWPGSDGRPGDVRRYRPVAGAYLWVRGLRGRAALIVTEA